MGATELPARVLALLQRVAPELDPALLDPALPLREQVDLDSMDFLNFLISIEQELHVGIPETDYAQLRTLDDLVQYLRRRLPAA